MSQALLFGNDVIAVKELLNFLRRGNKAVYNKSCLPLTPDKLFCSTRVQCPLTTSVSWTREPGGVRWAGQRVWPWPSRREVPARGGGGNRAPLLLTSLSYLSFLLRYIHLHIVCIWASEFTCTTNVPVCSPYCNVFATCISLCKIDSVLAFYLL